MITLYLPIFHMTPLATTLSKVWWRIKPQNLRPHLKMKKKNLKQRFLKKWLKFEMIITSYGLSGFDLKSGHLNSEKEEALDLQDGKKSLWKIIMDSISFLFHSIGGLLYSLFIWKDNQSKMNFHLLTLHLQSKRHKDKVSTFLLVVEQTSCSGAQNNNYHQRALF